MMVNIELSKKQISTLINMLNQVSVQLSQAESLLELRTNLQTSVKEVE